MCRATLNVRNPATHPVDPDLEAAARAAMPADVLETRLRMAKERLEEIEQEAERTLPVFFMHPGCQVGDPVLLHFFEPRYKILIRRAWEGRRLFVFCPRAPRRGERGVVVQVANAVFLPDGRANIVGRGVQQIVLGETWVEDGTGGLFYTRLDASRQGGADLPGPDALPDTSTGSQRPQPCCCVTM